MPESILEKAFLGFVDRDNVRRFDKVKELVNKIAAGQNPGELDHELCETLNCMLDNFNRARERFGVTAGPEFLDITGRTWPEQAAV